MHMRKLLMAGFAGATALFATHANAQSYYIGQVVLYANGYCPKGSTEAAGQLLSVNSNMALFSLFGTTYGGDGRTTFGLPDLRGRAAIGQGQSSGTTLHPQGQKVGSETVTLTISNLPSHTHQATMRAVGGDPQTPNPAMAAFADYPPAFPIYNSAATPDTPMRDGTAMTAAAGNNIPISVRAPWITLRYCVFTTGIFPSRG